MRQSSLIHRLVLLIAFMGTLSLNTSCSKNDNTPSPGASGSFKPEDFQVSNIIATVASDSDIRIEFDVKNISGRDYDHAASNQAFNILWKVKTTDGTVYQQDDYMPLNLSAGATSAELSFIDVSTGKTPDLSTLEYTVYQDY